MISAVREPCDEGVISADRGAAPCAPAAGKWVLTATILGSSMAFIDSTAVNVALPALQTGLNASVTDVQWVIESYALLVAAFLLVGGSLGDRYGRRRVFLIGIVIFAAASVWCGLAPSVRQLILARALQGFGAALLIPGSLAVISSSFREKDRGAAIGTWSGFGAITAAIGPVLGGWLIDHVSWRAVFFINLPLAACVILISLWRVPESSSSSQARLDGVGAILIVIGLGALVFGLIESSRLSFASWSVRANLALGGLVIAGFAMWERRTRDPMLPLSLFESRTFLGANLLTLLLYGALGGTLFFFPLNLIQVQHYSAMAAGAALLPFIVIMFVLSRWSGGLVRRYGARLPLIVGPLIAAAGFALFVLPTVNGSYWSTFFPAVSVLGLGMAISVAPLTTTVMNSVDDDHTGVASGVNNAVSRTAGLIAIAVFGVIALHRFDADLSRRMSALPLPPAAVQHMRSDRAKFAATEIPNDLPANSRRELRQALDLSFVAAFREVMWIGTVMAAVSSLSAALLVTNGKPEAAGGRRAR